jgi:hypothetical protein
MKYLKSILAASLILAFSASSQAQEAKPQPKAKKEHVAEAKVERVQCKAITKKGAQCKNKAMVGGEYCKRHATMMEKDSQGEKPEKKS